METVGSPSAGLQLLDALVKQSPGASALHFESIEPARLVNLTGSTHNSVGGANSVIDVFRRGARSAQIWIFVSGALSPQPREAVKG